MDLDAFDDVATKAKELLAREDPQGAARQLRSGWQAEGLDRDDQRMATYVEIVKGIADQMHLDKLAAAAATLMGGFDAQALYDLGFQLVDVGLPGPAIPVLQRLNRLVPGNAEVVSELAAAYERAQRHAMARDVLLEHPDLLEQEFWLRYLVCFNAISAADIETTRHWAPALEPTDEAQRHAVARLDGMLVRASAAKQVSTLELHDLRGWHYVINGGALLHLSPFGFDEGMQGRYAYLQDSEQSVARELRRLGSALQATWMPRKLLALQDQGSLVVAHALGRILSIPVHPFSATAEGLVVAYSTDRIEHDVLESLDASVRKGTRVFVRAAQWTEPPPFVPDYVGLLHQHLVAPWEEGMEADGNASTQTWAQRIADTPDVHEDDAIDDVDALLAIVALGIRPSDRWFTGPVTSSRFS